jgi:hypothetical protein
MAETAFEKVCALLPKLSGEELSKVKHRVQFLSNPSTPDNRYGEEPPKRETKVKTKKEAMKRASPGYDWLAAGFEAELRRRGVLGQEQRLGADRIRTDWASASEEMRTALGKHLAQSPGRTPWIAFGSLAARALAIYLEKGRVPVGPKTMVQNVDKVLLALEGQYPGYMEAGLLHSCLDPKLVGLRL